MCCIERKIEKCDKETLVSRRFTTDCMFKGNQYIVDNSDIVIAFWNDTTSDTDNTVEYAKDKGKTVVVIEP